MTDQQHAEDHAPHAADAPAGTTDDPTADGTATPAENAQPAGDGTAPPEADDDAPTGGDGHAAVEPVEDEPVDYEQRATDDGRSPGQLLEALEEAQTDRDDYLDALQRSRAEFDNYRRRSAREAAGARSAGVGDLAQQLLDVLDDLDRTVAVAEQSADDGLAAGIEAVYRKLVDVLRAAGVERIDEAGVPFDANRHEAVQQVPAEEPVDEPEVAQVLRPGYVHGDRCLRPAMVSVRQ